MLKVQVTAQFKKDYKRIRKQKKDVSKLTKVIDLLVGGKELPEIYRDHSLYDSKFYKNKRECHIEGDWVLVYEIKQEEVLLLLTRTGSHSELFR